MAKPFGFVYETTNRINGMKYIGKCIYGRANNWETYLGSGVYLKRAIRKYGKENFARKILAEAYSDEELNVMEELFIEKRNAVESPDYYNIKLTSIGGDCFTTNPDKEKIRSMRVKQMTGSSNHQFGKKKTARMIESVVQANSRAIIIDGIHYCSAAEASRRLSINTTTIMYRLDSDNFPDYQRLSPKNKKPTHKSAAYKCVVKGITYESIAKAAIAHNISTHAMRMRMYSKTFPDHYIVAE
ncbi:hypothetical protein NCCP2716_15240 [Sporosarcina sp. NCCP-2716]|uniref:hypothetical protein n=1 Tax=Sporosarcina sp. NCCP-2716 TaxID=2943679 RepID=UPI00203FE0F4|nr:hypothetical protein [Sporosarcina sp. NCCP-2716]GKV69026.1 hypothetical protein NCCP2716_15240 [Sporosarcina sp. NCCP-2716]